MPNVVEKGLSTLQQRQIDLGIAEEGDFVKAGIKCSVNCTEAFKPAADPVGALREQIARIDNDIAEYGKSNWGLNSDLLDAVKDMVKTDPSAQDLLDIVDADRDKYHVSKNFITDYESTADGKMVMEMANPLENAAP